MGWMVDNGNVSEVLIDCWGGGGEVMGEGRVLACWASV
jgi:hypothetical protein